MKQVFLLISLIFAHQAMAVCSSPITRVNYSALQVLTSTRLNTDLNDAYTRANELPGDCVTDETITTTQILDGTIVNADISASAAIDLSKTSYSVAILKDVQTSGTVSQTSVSATWNIRTLNTEIDADGIVTLASNQFTLAAGTYLIEGSDAAAVATNTTHMTKIYNVTDATSDIYGTSEYATTIPTRSIFAGTVTIASSKVFELRHYTTTGYAFGGFGAAASISSISETYAIVKITRIK